MKRTFAQRLKAARENQHLTQTEIAQKLGISQQRYQPWEGGKKGKHIEPPLDMLPRIADMLNVSLDWLITGGIGISIDDRINNYDFIVIEIIDILQDLDQDMRKEILKYAKEKKIVMDIKKSRDKTPLDSI